MTSRVLPSRQQWSISEMRTQGRHAALVVCIYVASYIALDWVSLVQVLPGVGFTLWNPPPAASLALLIRKGLRFAPALFVASVISDGVVEGYPLGIQPTLASEMIVAIGYTGVAAALRRWAHADQGFPRLADVAGLLVIAAAGVLITACLAVAAISTMHGMPPDLLAPSIHHFFIGDLTGIVGLLPVLLTFQQARERWKEVSIAIRICDVGIFGLGLGFALSVVFGVAHHQELQFFYLLLPPVAWIGVRHGLPCCAAAILIEQLALIFIITEFDYPRADFQAFQILSLTVTATGLILGAVVTERQRAEQLLRQQEAELSRVARITTAGALGGAIVHEITQPLAAVATYAHTCRRLLKSDSIDVELLSQTMASVESEIDRAGDIVERLRDFPGRVEQRRCPVDLAATIRRMAGMLAEEARAHGVTVRIDLRPAPQVKADRLQIEQVLMNLIRNAIEAVADCRDRERLVWIRLRQIDNDVQIEVEDNGPGVSPDIAQHLFEPFETSKLRGMGLGLWLSREIVKGHGGRLWWDATVVTGSRFVLRLPCSRK
ncbi:MAG: MASE1 domain-containing protein [Acetobacteraceae bacterium]|nr:MASE1 domain-containing protein [Acetobacteraceae bacterium]